jgi:hypothetical protein
MCHVCMWKVRGGDVPHHQQLHVAGSVAECYDSNTAMTASKKAGKLDLIKFNDNKEPRVKIMSIINEISFYILYKRERRRPAALHCCSCKCLLVAISANLC